MAGPGLFQPAPHEYQWWFSSWLLVWQGLTALLGGYDMGTGSFYISALGSLWLCGPNMSIANGCHHFIICLDWIGNFLCQTITRNDECTGYLCLICHLVKWWYLNKLILYLNGLGTERSDFPNVTEVILRMSVNYNCIAHIYVSLLDVIICLDWIVPCFLTLNPVSWKRMNASFALWLLMPCGPFY